MRIRILSNNHNLPEAPIFSKLRNKVYWVDILKKKLFSYSFKSKKIKSIYVTENPSAIFLLNTNKILFITIKGLFITNFKKVKKVLSFDFPKNFRTNDAKAINAKSIIFSIMDKKKIKRGKIFSLELSKNKKKLLASNFKIPNSIISKGKYIYFSDSAKGTIYKYSNNNGKKSVFFSNKNTEPDGAVFSKQNYFVFADYKNSEINFLNNNGKKISSIKLPCKKPTSLCFVGKNLNKMIITSAKGPSKYDGAVLLLSRFNKYISGKLEKKINEKNFDYY